MEITVDFVAARALIAREAAQAGTEIAELGPLPAYRRSVQRHDERLASAGDANALACQQGCSWCCHFSVDVRPVEVLNILEFVEQHCSAEELQRLGNEVQRNSRGLRHLNELERMRVNMRCPFLIEDRCGIYAARPQTCRNYHATDAAGCKQSFEEPDNFEIAPDFAPLVYQAGGAHVEAFSKAMRAAGYDTDAYELNAALAAAMPNAAAVRERFETRQKMFAAIEGIEVPSEFEDDVG